MTGRITVFHQAGDDAFICAAHGRFTVDVLQDIERQILENPIEGPDGNYEYSVNYLPAETGEFGMIEIAAGWELEQIGYSAFDGPEVA